MWTDRHPSAEPWPATLTDVATQRDPVVLPWRRVEGYQCFGCCPENAAGLGLRFVRESEWALSTRFEMAPHHESYPTVVHGGLAVTVLDELMGNALAVCRKRLCFTTGIRTRFIEPLRTERPYRALARIDTSTAGAPLWRAESEITDTAGNLLVTATGSYQTISRELARTEMGEAWMDWAECHGYLAGEK
jgi:acyl-coenzyme A thioesterase PaaI-like protein